METNKTKSFLSIKTMGDIVNELDGPLINISSKKYLEWKNKKWVAVEDILDFIVKEDLEYELGWVIIIHIQKRIKQEE